MHVVLGLACLLLACEPAPGQAPGISAGAWPAHDPATAPGPIADPAQLTAFADRLAISADCKDFGQSAGRKTQRLTKGDDGVLEEQDNFWLPRPEPIIRNPIPAHGPCLS